MRNALRALPAFFALAALGGCHEQTPQSDQNVAIDINNVSPNDIETLPADESSETPSNELANGFDTDNDVNATGNGY
jgi:phosphopantetheinyl transferase